MNIIKKIIRKMQTVFFTQIACFSSGGGVKTITANGFTWLGKRCETGKNCNFNGMRIRGFGRVFIGDNFHSGEGCLILTSNHNYEGESVPYDATNISKNVQIGNNVWIGSRVIILPGAVLGEGCIIQAGSVVAGHIPPCSIAGGHPAKVFAERNREHYEKMVQERRFF